MKKENLSVRITRDFTEKQKTRPLYEQAFADPPAFVDYYYKEKCADNQMVLLEEDGHIRSMVHLNPYTVSVCGNEVPSYYLVAVATEEKSRRKGYMARVLEAAFEEMKRQEIPFCFLLPVDEAIYTPFGFETICSFVTRENPDSKLAYPDVQQRFDVYCVQDALYGRRRKKEDALAKEDASEVLPEDPVIMARVIDEQALSGLLLLPPGTEARTQLARLKSLRCYFREEV